MPLPALVVGLSLALIACGGGGVSSDSGVVVANPQGSSGDTAAPTVSIASPASGTTTANAVISVSGSASDNVGVTSVSWRNSSTGASGTASGTTSWTADGIALQGGANTIVVTARDAAGNTRSDQITVTYAAPQNSATLSWDPNTETDLAGYRIYYGLSSGSYLQSKGNGVQISSNAYTVAGLNSSTRYYFAVTAVDIAGNESDYSNEVFKDIP